MLLPAHETTSHRLPGSSSGLHHDFHDNLYVLIHGRKSFRLFSPGDADKMHTLGPIELVHPNGRICYAVSIIKLVAELYSRPTLTLSLHYYRDKLPLLMALTP